MYDEQISQHLSAGCSCSETDHFSAMETGEVRSIFQQISAEPEKETDAFLLGVLSAGMFADNAPYGSQGARKWVKFRYSVFGQEVCRAAFSYVFRISSTGLKRLNKLAAQKFCLIPSSSWRFGTCAMEHLHHWDAQQSCRVHSELFLHQLLAYAFCTTWSSK